MGILKGLTQKNLPKIAITFITAATTNLMAKESIQSAIRGRIRKLVTDSSEKPYKDVQTVENIRLFRTQNIDIMKTCGNLTKIIILQGQP